MTKQEKLIKAERQLRQRAADELTKRISDCRNELYNSTEHLQKMPLSVYKEIFEPIFTGKVVLNEQNIGIIGKYVSYAGSPKKPVLVVDENNVVVMRLDGIYQLTPLDLIQKISSGTNFTNLANTIEAAMQGRRTNLPIMEEETAMHIKTTVLENVPDRNPKLEPEAVKAAMTDDIDINDLFE